MENVNTLRKRLIRHVWMLEYYKIVVILVCILLAVYGQELILAFLHSLHNIGCSRYAWIIDWLFGSNGNLILWKFNNCM